MKPTLAIFTDQNDFKRKLIMSMTAQQKIERVHVSLLKHTATIVYSGVIMVGTYEVRKDVPTARTNGLDVQYGEDFVNSLPEEELRAIVLHEALHKVYQHTFLARGLYNQNPEVANIAVDLVVNLDVKDIERETNGFVKLPEGSVYDEKYRGLSSSHIFAKLMQQRGSPQDGGDQGKGGKGKSQEGQAPSDGRGKKSDEHDWEGASKMSESEVKDIQGQVDQAMRQGQVLAGNMGGSKSRVFDKLTEVKEDWRDLLRDYLTSFSDKGDISTWRKPARKWLQHDIYLPSTYSETMGRVAIAVDLSGSVGQEELTQFMSHIVAVCGNVKPEMIDLLYWDTSVNVHETYAQDELGKLLSLTKPVGGGGTSPQCIDDYMRKHKLKPECLIILSDGYVDNWPMFEVPALWAIVGGNKCVPTHGQVVYIED